MAERLREGPSNTIASWGLFAAVAAAPLLFGATDPATIAFWCIVLGVSLAFAGPAQLRRLHMAMLCGIAIVAAGYAFVLHEQLAERPWIAPFHPIWAEMSKLLGQPLQPSAAIARDQPLFAFGAPLAALLALTLGLIIGTDRVRARQVLTVLAWSGMIYAVLGIVQLALDPSHLLWRERIAYFGTVTGPFINRNTAASYFGICATIWILVVAENIRAQLPPGPIVWSAFFEKILEQKSPWLALSFTGFFVCLAAMFMSGSRAGVVVSFTFMVIALVLYFRSDISGRMANLTFVAAMIGGASLLFFTLGSGINYRLEVEGSVDASRFETYKSTLRLIADNPWFGTGMGTFPWSYPAYRSSAISMMAVYDRAHSTPLELAAELGLPLTAVIVLAWAAMLVLLARGFAIRRRDRILPLAALSAGLIAAVHSCVDFPLQIPGYAVPVFALLGIGLAQSVGSERSVLNE